MVAARQTDDTEYEHLLERYGQLRERVDFLTGLLDVEITHRPKRGQAVPPWVHAVRLCLSAGPMTPESTRLAIRRALASPEAQVSPPRKETRRWGMTTRKGASA